MADEQRQRKVEKIARKIAGNFFTAHNPPGQLVTVTRAGASSDLSHLTIFVNLLPEADNDNDLEKLRKHLPQLRKEIGDKISFRRVPEVHIELDQRETSRRRVEKILDKAD